MKEPCVVCGEDSQGCRGEYDLCEKHWKEVEREDARRIVESKDVDYRQAQAKFAREYPGIPIKKRRGQE
jgi:hypothetical protein